MKQNKLMDSLEEIERKRERKLKAIGLIEKTLEDEMNERKAAKKHLIFDKSSSIKSLNFSDSFTNDTQNSSTPYRLPKLYSN